MNKTEIRDTFIELRSDLTPRQVQLRSARIASRLKSLIDWPLVNSLHMYQSVPAWKEVDTYKLYAYICSTWPHIDVVMGDAHQRSTLPDRTFDVILVPLLAFDENANRLGFGGGWYDRFLANQADSKKIGLAYEIQRAPHLPVESHDVCLDIVVTERKIVKQSVSRQ
jgi:5-formyltetrahydrofolate cyclo-ligase